jgi:hypothetical protein
MFAQDTPSTVYLLAATDLVVSIVASAHVLLYKWHTRAATIRLTTPPCQTCCGWSRADHHQSVATRQREN